MVDKSAMIICVSGAKALPSGRVKFDCQNFEFSLASRTSFCHACGQVVASNSSCASIFHTSFFFSRVDANQGNLRSSAYEAVMELIKNSAKVTSFASLKLCLVLS